MELGRRLFYDARLSGNGTQSCASCHDQARAFTDGRPRSIGSTGETHPRGAQGLANVAYFATLTWANPVLRTLEQQALVPMFSDAPVELGPPSAEALLVRLRSEPYYPPAFAGAFPETPAGADAVTLDHVTKALGAFQRTLLSGRAPYDRHLAGDATALSESAKRGLALFFSERLECYHCHGGYAFSDSVVSKDTAFFEAAFHNNALYDLDGQGAYPPESRGLVDVTGKAADMGRFRAPSLRNVTVTAPYFHDGSAATLDDVLDHYAAGGRRSRPDPTPAASGARARSRASS